MSYSSLSNYNNLLLTPLKNSIAAQETHPEEDTINSLKIYYALNHQFKVLGRSELTERMIRRITKCDYIPKDFQARPLYINLSGIIDELMLTELEIALWAIYLENLVWKNLDTYTEQLLLFSAYKAKQYFNGNSVEPYLMYLKAKIGNFEENFKSWLIKYEDGFKVNLRMINEKLNMLKIVKDAESDYCSLDYNYYVDVILLKAVPYADRGEQRAILKPVERRKNEELMDKKTKRQTPMKIQTEKINMKKKKIEKDSISSINYTENDPDIAKIEKFCDGLIDYNDLNPDDFK
ncbi:unnamed protein product [Blepharisma stoltei]|uniref:Uncharacterized protein n=1 Tax=Blepharisma stoltei TaxID=1481888 RepID=A0AAU9ISQ8_9CILI|nr:unnamed protein product [Blepharisma stoltei]